MSGSLNTRAAQRRITSLLFGSLRIRTPTRHQVAPSDSFEAHLFFFARLPFVSSCPNTEPESFFASACVAFFLPERMSEASFDSGSVDSFLGFLATGFFGVAFLVAGLAVDFLFDTIDSLSGVRLVMGQDYTLKA